MGAIHPNSKVTQLPTALIPWGLRAFQLSEPFQDSVKQMSPNELRAKMSLRLLSLIALDPAVLGQVPKGVPFLPRLRFTFEIQAQQGTQVVFNLHLYQVVNPVGVFDLPAAHPLCLQLQAAIEANLAGQRYKAAKMLIRLKTRAQTSRNRYRTYVTYTDSGEPNMAITEALNAKLDRRLAAIAQIAAPGLEKGYYSWVADLVSAPLLSQ